MSQNEQQLRKQREEEEIRQNIEKLRNKMGDARTGGKGSQRRKVKVVSKAAVSI